MANPKSSEDGGAPGMWRCILAPVDFSPRSIAALRYARHLARERCARLIVLHVVQPYHPDWRMDTTHWQRMERAHARRQLKELVTRELAPPLSVRAKLRVGHPVEEIIALANECEVDLIVIATHGRTGLPHVLIGSVAERVVRRAPCPVLVLRSYPAARKTIASPPRGV